jgi:hypothetical protein
MSIKGVLFGRAAFGAYIGAAAAIFAAFLLYLVGERQRDWDHRKWLADSIMRISVNNTEVARGMVVYLNKSKVLPKEDDEMLCRIFGAACPEKR